MNYNPHTHLEIARARQADLIREADRRRLANLVAEKRPGLVSRLRGHFGEHSAKQPVVRPA
ncbi:MAG TPA: hypothetical protein VGJ34_02460 [Gaiellaceae bacterium]|jgi:hypothetical protein